MTRAFLRAWGGWVAGATCPAAKTGAAGVGLLVGGVGSGEAEVEVEAEAEAGAGAGPG